MEFLKSDVFIYYLIYIFTIVLVSCCGFFCCFSVKVYCLSVNCLSGSSLVFCGGFSRRVVASTCSDVFCRRVVFIVLELGAGNDRDFREAMA